MSLKDLSIQELMIKHGRLLSATVRVWTEIQKREGMEGVEQKIASLPKRQRDFVSALWNAPDNEMESLDIEEKVWGKSNKVAHETIKEESVRHFVWRLEKEITKRCIPILIDTIKGENGDVAGYKLKKIKKK